MPRDGLMSRMAKIQPQIAAMPTANSCHDFRYLPGWEVIVIAEVAELPNVTTKEDETETFGMRKRYSKFQGQSHSLQHA